MTLVAPYQVAELSFDLDALAPAIGRAALAHHHDCIHRGYAVAVNHMLASFPKLAELTVEALLAAPEHIPISVRDVLLDLAGAHANHQFFWKIVSPKGASEPNGTLAAAIARDFGSVINMQSAFATAARSIEQPGFAFLSLIRPKDPGLEILALPRNSSVLPIGKPGVLICDLWPHAWQSDHPTLDHWIDAFWTIVDWRACGHRYDALVKGEKPR